MTKSYYDFYCDESAIDGSGSFYFGALYCSPIRANILRNNLKIIREKYELKAEMKWTKISTKMLTSYIYFANIFLDDPFARFIVMEVKRDSNWRNWASNEEERFFKSYYVFLRMNMSTFSRYGVYLDYKPSKWYRWSSLQFSINNAVRRDYYPQKQKQIHTLKPVDSKSDDLLQLTDLLLGALTSNATASAKTQFAQHIRQHLSDNTQSNHSKFAVSQWTPTVKK